MIKYTQQQLLEIAETEPEKLNELVALAQGYFRVSAGWMLTDNSIIPLKDYSPITNNAQAWVLMVDCNLDIDRNYGRFAAYIFTEYTATHVTHKNPNITVVIAAILYLQGKGNE